MAEQNAPFEVKFTGIELVSKLLEEPIGIVPNQTNFAINFLVDLKLSAEAKVAITVTEITIFNPENEKRFAFFKTFCIFELPNFDSVFEKNAENKYVVPVNVEIILKGTGLSTTRGVVYSELRGTYLDRAILPIVDIAKLILEQKELGRNIANEKSEPSKG